MLYIEIVDFSAEKALARPLCNRGLSNGEIIVIIVITDIAVVLLIAILKKRDTRKFCGIP